MSLLLSLVIKLMKYRVYQNMTEFACDVEADNEEEAIKKAHKVKEWDSYEPNEDNITYEVVCQELPDMKDIKLPDLPESVSDGEKLNMAKVIICELMEILEGLEREDKFDYTHSDDILYSEEMLKLIDGEMGECDKDGGKLALGALEKYIKNNRRL